MRTERAMRVRARVSRATRTERGRRSRKLRAKRMRMRLEITRMPSDKSRAASLSFFPLCIEKQASIRRG